MTKATHKIEETPEDMERMNKALKAALETPPRKHADEPKRGKKKPEKKSSGV